MTTKSERRDERRQTINGAAYGQSLVPGRMAPADTIPVSPELADALSEAAQTAAATGQFDMEALMDPMPEPVRLGILDDARAAISGDRDTTYGGPEDSFTRIAGLWEAQFGYHFDAGMVAQALALLKLARLSKNPTHRDSWVDLAGYAACGAEAA